MKLGVVGLPNVGKSTLFNAITHAGAECANYPFCTIEPNVGVVAVPDERLDKLAELYEEFPWAKQNYIYSAVHGSNGEIRYVKSNRPIVIGKKYI